jgi:hypothetical protein
MTRPYVSRDPNETLDPAGDSAFDLMPVQTQSFDISQALIFEMAQGWEEPEAIAARYGYVDEAWVKLSTYKPFLQAVDAQKAELERDGTNFRMVARTLTADVFTDAYRIAKSNDSTLLQKLEFIKLGAKLGDMEPKAAAQTAAIGGSVTIVFTTEGKPAPMTIEADPA